MGTDGLDTTFNLTPPVGVDPAPGVDVTTTDLTEPKSIQNPPPTGGVAENMARPGATIFGQRFQLRDPTATPAPEPAVAEEPSGGASTASPENAAAAARFDQMVGGRAGSGSGITVRSYPPTIVAPAGTGTGGSHVHEEHSHEGWHPRDIARAGRASDPEHAELERLIKEQREAHAVVGTTAEGSPARDTAMASDAKAKKAADDYREAIDDIHGEPEKDEKTWWGKWIRPALGDLFGAAKAFGDVAGGIGAIVAAYRIDPAHAQILAAEAQARTTRDGERLKKKELDAAGEQLADKGADRLAQAKAARDQARAQKAAEADKANASMFAKKGSAPGDRGPSTVDEDRITQQMRLAAQRDQFNAQRARGLKA